MPKKSQQTNTRKFGVGVAAVVLIIAAGALGWQLFGGRESGRAPVEKTTFYTDDNGKTFFKEDVNKLPPFEHNGKQAYRCDVFQDAGGKQFVGLVYRYTDSGRKMMQDFLPKQSKDSDGSTRRAIDGMGMQVKPVAANETAWELADEVACARLQSTVKDSRGKPARLVVP